MTGDQQQAEERLTGIRYLATGSFRRMAGIAHLEARINTLEKEIASYRTANVRLAELLDLAQELLVPAATRDEEKLSRLLERYTDELGT